MDDSFLPVVLHALKFTTSLMLADLPQAFLTLCWLGCFDVCVCVFVYLHSSISISLYIYIYISTDRQI